MKLSRFSLVVAASAAAASVLAGGVAYAATGSGTATTPPTAGTPTPPGAQPLHRGRHRDLAARAEHAELVMHGKAGDRVLDLQRGHVTALSPAAGGKPATVTLTSADGFSATYSLTLTSGVSNNGKKDPPSSLTVGENARVRAIRNAGTDQVLHLAAHTPRPKAGTSTHVPSGAPQRR